MTLHFCDLWWRTMFDAHAVSARAQGWVQQHWPMLACGVFGVATRVGLAALPLVRLELVAGTASVSAALVLIETWGRDADDLRRGGRQAMVAAVWCAFCATVGS